MKVLAVLLLAVGLASYAEASVGDILDEYDWLAIAKSDQQLQRILFCVGLVVPCDNLGKLKENGIKIFKSDCGDCTPAQKKKFEDYKAYMQEHRPVEYALAWKIVNAPLPLGL